MLSDIITKSSQILKYNLQFETVLDYPEFKHLFCHFLEQARTLESYEFIGKVHEYMTLHSDQKRYHKAEEIINEFLRNGSEKEVNAVSNMRNDVIEIFSSKCSPNNCSPDLFKQLFTVILRDLKEDSWPRFKRSEEFGTMVMERVKKDQSFVLDLCEYTEEPLTSLVDEYLSDEDKLQTLLVDIRRSQGVGLDAYHPIKVKRKKRKIFAKKYENAMGFTGYEIVNWISGYLQLKRPSALKFIHQVLQRSDFEFIEYLSTRNSPRENDHLVRDSAEEFYGFVVKKRLVVIGGGYAGSALCKNLQDEFDITLIDQKPKFESVFSFHQLLHNPEAISKISCDHRQYLKTGRIVVEKVDHIAPYYVQLKQNGKIYFDYLVVSTGSSYVQFPVEITEKQPIIVNPYSSKSLIDNHEHLKQSKRVVCVGGGSVSVEVAGEIAHYFPETSVTLVTQGTRLMNRTSPTVHENAVKLLSKYKNISIKTGIKVLKIRDSSIVYIDESTDNENNQREIPFDLVVVAVGFSPNTSMFRDQMSSSLDQDGRVKVNSRFQVQKGVGDEFYDNIFALGDITDMDEEKLAQSAQKNAIKLTKILQNFELGESKAKNLNYVPKKRVMIISVGPNAGIMIRDEKVLLENALLLRAKRVVEYNVMRGLH